MTALPTDLLPVRRLGAWFRVCLRTRHEDNHHEAGDTKRDNGAHEGTGG
jgi:hypothetical protein